MKWKSIALGLAVMNMGFCAPKGGSVLSGKAQIAEKGSRLDITASDKSVIHWDDFSISKGEMVKFIQPNKNSASLNKVVGNKVSEIFGRLEANGRVYLINPNGLLVGKEGVIDTAAFVASSLDVHTQTFLNNGALDFIGDPKGNVINLGKITAWDGDVLLIGKQVSNPGDISAKNGEVYLLGATDLILKPSGEKRLYIKSKNLDPKKLSDNGNPFSAAFCSDVQEDALDVQKQGDQIFLVEHSGNIEAQKVYVLGDKVSLKDKAIIDVSNDSNGGEVYIGGGFDGKGLINSKQTSISKDVKILARSNKAGNGGKVAIFSDGKTNFSGSVDVRGGENKGDGGFVEVSGTKGIIFKGVTDRRAQFGKPGELLIDPESDITLHLKSSYAGRFEDGLWIPFDGESYIEFGSALQPGTIVFELTQGDVTVQTTGSGFTGRQGNIIINDQLEYYNPQGNTLTLRAAKDIIVNGRLICTSKGNIVLEARRDLLLDATDSKTPIEISSVEGMVYLKEIGRDAKLIGGKIADACAIIGCYKTKEHGDCTVRVGTIGQDLILKGGTNNNTFAQIGTHLSKHAGGNIYFHKINRNLILQGGEGDGAYAQIGHAHTLGNDGVLKANITIDGIGGDLFLKANRGKAHIGHGSIGDRVHHQSGDITIRSIQGDFLLHGGQQEFAFAQLGHASKQGLNGSKEGNISILGLQGKCDLEAGHIIGCYSMVGHGGREAVFEDAFIMGNISVSYPKVINLRPSMMGEPDTFAIIGHAVPNAENLHMFCRGVTVKSLTDINLQGGGGANSVIGMLVGTVNEKSDIALDHVRVLAENNINLQAYLGEYDTKPTETVIGISKANKSDANLPIETSLIVQAGGEISLSTSEVETQYQHDVYIRGVLEPKDQLAESVITAKNDITIIASDFGEAGLIFSGSTQIKSEEKKIRVFSSDKNDGFITNIGQDLNVEALGEIELISKETKAHSGKINIIMTDPDDSPSVVYSGDVYESTIPTDVYTIEETNQHSSHKLNKIVSSKDVIYVDAISDNSNPAFTLNVGLLDFICTYNNCTLQAFYESNIIVSEFLFRQTPILEFMGCPEEFSICYKKGITTYCPCSKKHFRKKHFDVRDFYTRRPFNGYIRWCNPL